jgi:hypothetical protein
MAYLAGPASGLMAGAEIDSDQSVMGAGAQPVPRGTRRRGRRSVLVGLDGQHCAVRLQQDRLGVAAEHELRDG